MQEFQKTKFLYPSLVNISLMMFFTSIHHIFRLGYGLLIPSLILTIIPFGLARWYTNSKNTAILKTFTAYNLLMFIWFGFIDGFLDHVLKAIGLENTTFLPGGEAEVVKTVLSLGSPQVSNIFYEGTGALAFIFGFFAVVYLLRMIQVKHTLDKMKAE